MTPVLTAHRGENGPLFDSIMGLYVPPGCRVLDMTYGRGSFWAGELRAQYQVITMDNEKPADIQGDFRYPPFKSRLFQAIVLDPPYGNQGGDHKGTMQTGVDKTYNLKAGNGTDQLRRLYVMGIVQASILIVQNGHLIVKCQDYIEGGRQHWMHDSVRQWAEQVGFTAQDLFVLMQSGKPAMRHDHQVHARKNHSYFWIFTKTGALP